MVRKKKMAATKKPHVTWLNFSLSPDTHQKVKEVAKKEETTVAALVRRLLREYVAA